MTKGGSLNVENCAQVGGKRGGTRSTRGGKRGGKRGGTRSTRGGKRGGGAFGNPTAKKPRHP